MTRRARLAAALLAAQLLAGCAGARGADPAAAARRIDEEAVAQRDPDVDDSRYARQWLVVQHGDIAAVASLPDDAVRTAEQKSPDAPHRFVFRPTDRGPRFYRMAFVSDGGVVAGSRFLADLGLEATLAAGRPATLRRRGGGAGIDLAGAPRFAIDVATLDGASHVQLEAAYDPDFDGGLLVPRDVAATLRLERFELPGGAEVQVALARPFSGVRATVIATVPALQTSAPAEVVFETAPRK